MLPRHLTLLKFNRVEIRRPYFDPHPSKSTTHNHAWRLGLFILLTDRHGREYIWMPRWRDLNTMNQGRIHVETLNRRRCEEAAKKRCSHFLRARAETRSIHCRRLGWVSEKACNEECRYFQPTFRGGI